MSNPQIELLVEMYRFCMNATLGVAGKVPPAGRFRQIKDGKAHPLWLIGHLANTIEVVGNHWALGGDYRLPKSYGRDFAPDFAGGKPITAEPSDYALWEEACAKYAEASERYLSGLAELLDSDLSAKPKIPVRAGAEERFSTIGAIARLMIVHDNYHRGQMVMLAKSAE